MAMATLLWRSSRDSAPAAAPALRPELETGGDVGDTAEVFIRDAGVELGRLDAAHTSEQSTAVERSTAAELASAAELAPAPTVGPCVIASYSDGRPAVEVAVLYRRGELGDIQRDSNSDESWLSGESGTVPVPLDALALLVDPSAQSWFAADIPLAERNPVQGRLDESGAVVVPVPPTAALVLEFSEAEGQLWNGRGRVVFPGQNHRRNQVRFEGARVRIAHVRCERPVTLAIDSLGTYKEVELTLPPLRVDEGERTHRVILHDLHPIGLARFVDEANAPVGETRGLVEPGNAVIHTHHDGRAKFALRTLAGDMGAQTIRFLVYRSSRSYELEGEVTVETPLSPGVVDLGVVVLKPIDCLVSGYLLQPDGVPWTFMDLTIVGRAEDGIRRTVDGGMTGSDGSFLVMRDRPGVGGLRELALDIALDESPKLAAPVQFEAGKRDLVVTVSKPGSLFGTVRWEGPLPVPALEVLWLRPEARPIRVYVHGDGAISGSVPLGTGALVVATGDTSDPLTDARSVTIAAETGGAVNWTVGAGVQDLRFTLEGKWRVRPKLTYRTRTDGPFDHTPQQLGRGSYRIPTRAPRIDLQCRMDSETNQPVSVIEDLRNGEVLELGPAGLVRAP